MAVLGRLVPQNTSAEHVQSILKTTESTDVSSREVQSIIVTGSGPNRATKSKGDNTLKTTRGVPELPTAWKWLCWADLLAPSKASFKRGPFGSSLTKAIFVAEGYKVYEQYCPINDDCSFARYYITPQKFKELEAFAVQAGDFLISCSGSLGRITQIPDEYEKGVINQALLRVRIDPRIISHQYFKMLFRSPYFQEQIFDNSRGMAIPNVKGVEDLKAISIPLPPLEEQHRIVAKVDELMALCDALESSLRKAQTESARLLEATLHEALNP